MIENSSLWVVSDVDGTLMDHSYDLSPAKETIYKLKKLSIPENGAAIYGETLKKVNGEIILGQKYEILEEILNIISKEINFKLIPLNNLSDQEATHLTGLKGNSLNLMRERHWSMPFLNPPSFLEESISVCCKKFKVDIFKGNRMSHLLSSNSNKGKAINALKKYSNNQNIKIVGLGDSPNDLPLLLNSDIKIVIPGIDGPNLNLLNQLNDFEFTLASEPNGYGWKTEINKLLNKLKQI